MELFYVKYQSANERRERAFELRVSGEGSWFRFIHLCVLCQFPLAPLTFLDAPFGLAATGPQVLPQNEETAPKQSSVLSSAMLRGKRSELFHSLAGVLLFSAIPFTAVKAIANSPLGESLQRKMEEEKKSAEKNSSKFKALADKARKERTRSSDPFLSTTETLYTHDHSVLNPNYLIILGPNILFALELRSPSRVVLKKCLRELKE
ncbi:hypothetical protein V8G54_037964 (chloroplast) [Vigna mungo]|uniref:Uncharacterized protein n=1 Tax=Vigna mungo TaxID=3915 RepID=A0AAQ3MD82_VIGMU